MMKATDVFLLMLKAADGTIRGKTLAHKRGYFLEKRLNVGLNYRPHYYGPYSPKLETAIGRCRALGFVDQKTVNYGFDAEKGFELKRFDFSLTPDGETLVDNLKNREPEKYEEILELFKEITDKDGEDYVKLSLAAKTMFVLEERGKEMSYEEIVQEAKKYNWDISDKAVDKVAVFLQSMGLVKKASGEEDEENRH